MTPEFLFLRRAVESNHMPERHTLLSRQALSPSRITLQTQMCIRDSLIMFFPKSYSLYSTTPLYLVTIFNAHMDIFEIICHLLTGLGVKVRIIHLLIKDLLVQDGILTVSYTHLDVYKRQVSCNAVIDPKSETIRSEDGYYIGTCLLYTSRCV